MIKYHNKKLLDKPDMAMVQGLAHFICNKFFSKRLRDVLDINIHFHKNYQKETGMNGDCIWEDQHYRPREFTINIDASQKMNMVLNTLAHELVHVKQWAKGEMYELQSKRKCYKFKGTEYSRDDMDYWDYPWEIEAHGYAVGLVVQWTRTFEMTRKEKDKLILGA